MTKKIQISKIFFIICYFFTVLTNEKILAQTQNSLQLGTSNRLSVTLSNTIGVQTSANGSENLDIDNEANLVLKPGSTIQDSFGSEDNPDISGEFTVSPNGASFNLTGLVAENNYEIGEGTKFTSVMKNIDKDKPSNGNASSSLFHNMTLTVDQTNSSFTSSFSQDF
tara:strand:+ start:135 stop:635 length:501 start_codon:yes stop_codon:yes gene_type:complete